MLKIHQKVRNMVSEETGIIVDAGRVTAVVLVGRIQKRMKLKDLESVS